MSGVARAGGFQLNCVFSAYPQRLVYECRIMQMETPEIYEDFYQLMVASRTPMILRISVFILYFVQATRPHAYPADVGQHNDIHLQICSHFPEQRIMSSILDHPSNLSWKQDLNNFRSRIVAMATCLMGIFLNSESQGHGS